MIFDLAMPPEPLARMQENEPCYPFPPFCSTINSWWSMFQVIFADKWEGEIVQKGYGQNLGTVVNVKMSANGASDIRFLALYGMHTFAPSRFCPAVWLVIRLLLVSLLIVCCCHGCTCFKRE